MTVELPRIDPVHVEESFIHRLAQTLPFMIRVTGTDNQHTYCSPQWLELTGRTMAQEMAIDWAEIVHPDECQRCLDAYRDAASASQGFEMQFRLRCADGRYRWLLEQASPRFGPNGEFEGFIGFCVDITELKRRQQDLQVKNDELKQVARQRGEALSIADARLRKDISRRMLVEQRLLEQQDQLRKLVSEVTVAQERERRRIARGLHDEIGQVLALARLKISELLHARSTNGDLGQLENIGELLAQAARATRSATFELSSPVLHELGLGAALQRLGEECARREGIRFCFRPQCELQSLADRIRIVVYRALRELFLNIEKHAQANQVTLTIRRSGSYLQFAVEDDGIGTDTSRIGAGFDPTGGFGLFSVSEQIIGLGGRFEITSPPGSGTRAVVAVPLN